MNTFKIVVSIDCNTEDEAKAFEKKLEGCLTEAKDNSEISGGYIDIRREVQGTVGLTKKVTDEELEDIPIQLSYDELFEPDDDVL